MGSQFDGSPNRRKGLGPGAIIALVVLAVLIIGVGVCVAILSGTQL